ncbi:serine/threonine-protein kinase MRCK alpha isoform X3 [Lingula anatina]|uniref:non-specific serine/threonine protein kinase n=1 Tax=Lingula anatina TaxID=7574 RepID=A0A1S3JV58_LINAN|nr:serine/threonine-protein kinase MRCK alpha isoform X3 [Lingula anatina]XP_013414270.1 serine/threonine-protein kinase MRCK alpha isoform X3 [Lingula anatina]|eukprot:XP_013414269.1 serine/threonine-protein kinase MRCK alpha isoform X3 [Lingula anatina]
MTAIDRIKKLETLYLGGVGNSDMLALSMETLLDVLVVLYDECCGSTLRREKSVSEFVEFAKPVVARIKQLRLQRDDFEILKVIGRGAFGEVAVVKLKNTDTVYAMKILNKWEMLKRAETACFKEERDVLVKGDRRWITNLHYAFQDDDYLYLVMDYYCGGDLLTLLSKFEDRLPEDMAKFYIAEMVLAIDSLHRLRYVHRDIKPDNVLLDRSGHIVLADFGSCLRLMNDGTVQSNVAVGTPDYISPEILRAMEDGHGRYGAECDWWSLGVCMYEMLYGETPFYAESLVETYGKIMNHKNRFEFPADINDVSEEAKDLMRRLICSQDQRLGQNGIEDFINHPWFEGRIDWENIRQSEPPYIPDVSSPTDTSNFDVEDTDFKQSESVPPTSHSVFTGHHLPFVGFTFTSNSRMSDLEALADGFSQETSEEKTSSVSTQAYERRIQRLEQENKELDRKLKDATRVIQSQFGNEAPGSPSQSADRELQHLRTEVVRLQAQVKETQRDLDETLAIKQELETMEGDKNTKLKALEKSSKNLSQEKSELQQELESLQERYRTQTKELKDAIGQRKLAIEELTNITERLEDTRSGKQKLQRQLRDKEEELEDSRLKLDNLKQDLRKAEKAKRDLQTQLDESTAEASKQSKLRERSESYAKELEQEIETMKQKSLGRTPSTSNLETTQEINRLKAELEKKEVQYEEMIARLKQKHSTAIQDLHYQIQDIDNKKTEKEREVQTLKEKIDLTKKENISNYQENINDIKRKNEREKTLLEQENLRLTKEVEKLSRDVQKNQNDKRQIEEELRDLSEKRDSVAHWEAQISEIIQWVSDEKDARGYLQALASKMTDELEGLKMQGVGVTGERSWTKRRSQRVDKMELLSLQSQLQSEIQAKQSISEDLTQTKAKSVELEKQVLEAQAMCREWEYEVNQLRAENKELKARLEGEELKESLNFKDFTVVGDHDRPSSQVSFRTFLEQQTRRLGSSTSDVSEDDIDNYSIGSRGSRGSRNSDLSRPVNRDRVSLQDSSDKDEKQPATINNAHPVDEPKRTLPIQVIKPSNQPRSHRFAVRTFSTPVKCNHCTSLMVGLQRQGTVCEVCHYACHVLCTERAPQVCPVPPDQTKRPLGIDPAKGIGTAYEGYVRIPKPGGIKKGWMRQFVVVCDFKLFLYDINPEKTSQASVQVNQVLDMRDEEFSVSSVLQSDVIHANRRDITCIFRVTTSQLHPPGSKHAVLMLAENESDKQRWVGALNELHKILRKNKIPDKSVFQAKEVYDSSLSLLRNTLSGAILDHDTLLLGTEEGLHCIDLTRDEISRIGDKKSVFQIEVVQRDQLVIVISGKQRHIRLIPMAAVESAESVESVKINETRGCTTICTGLISQGSVNCLCVAIKRTVVIYELTRTKQRHKRVREILVPGNVQYIEMMNERLCVGYPSSFAIYTIQGEGAPVCLVNSEDTTLQFLLSSPVDAYLAVELSHKEYLLVFATLAIYVDNTGKRSRLQEIMIPAQPHSFSYNAPYLTCYAEEAAFVFDTRSEEWIQTICLKKLRPLCRDGAIGLPLVSDTPRLVYIHQKSEEEDRIAIPDMLNGKGRSLNRSKRRFSFKEEKLTKQVPDRRSRMISAPINFAHVAHVGKEETVTMIHRSASDRRSKLISAPTNFSHIAHMGPDQGMKMLIDLPTSSGQGLDDAQVQRVKSMFQPNFGANVLAMQEAAHVRGSGGSGSSGSGSGSRPNSMQPQYNGSAVRHESPSGSSQGSPYLASSSVASASPDSSSLSSQEQFGGNSANQMPSPIQESDEEPDSITTRM